MGPPANLDLKKPAGDVPANQQAVELPTPQAQASQDSQPAPPNGITGTRRRRRGRLLSNRQQAISNSNEQVNSVQVGAVQPVQLVSNEIQNVSLLRVDNDHLAATLSSSSPASTDPSPCHHQSNQVLVSEGEKPRSKIAGKAEAEISEDGAQSLGVVVTPSVNAVRVLFRDQQQVQPHLPSSTQSTSYSSELSTTSHTGNQLPAIVNANRRLIERQIEALQEADSRRWNFDFSNCRPLLQTNHRYIHYSPSPMRICRPLNDQNQSATTRYDSQQQCRPSTHEYKTRSDNYKKDDV